MNVLVIAPHADDEILGVGGTISRKIAEGNAVYVCIVTHGVEPLFSENIEKQIREETIACHDFLGIKHTYFLGYPAVMLEQVPRYELNGSIKKVVAEVSPDEVYIPHWGDMQKDHQMVAEACMVALRPRDEQSVKRIYAYETLSETGWNIANVQNAFIPNVYVDISDFLDVKLRSMKFYESQLCAFPQARSLNALEALSRYRGTTVSKCAAEAFALVREVL